MSYITHLATLSCIYIILAVSLNLVVGFTGMLNLGHAAFFAIGAYASALLTMAGVPFLIAFPLSFIIAAIFGILIGIPSLRLRGDYLAIATLGFGEIIRAILKNWISLTRGPLGIPGIPKASMFGIKFGSENFLVLAVIVTIITIIVVYRLVHSPFGRVLRAIREDELSALSLGKNVHKYKLLALLIGAGFAGIAGSLYAHFSSLIDPSIFTLTETILILSMVIIGGLGSIMGSIIGAIMLVLLPEPLRFLQLPSTIIASVRQMLYSLLLILFMLYKPNGLFGEKKHHVKNNKPA